MRLWFYGGRKTVKDMGGCGSDTAVLLAFWLLFSVVRPPVTWPWKGFNYPFRSCNGLRRPKGPKLKKQNKNKQTSYGRGMAWFKKAQCYAPRRADVVFTNAHIHRTKQRDNGYHCRRQSSRLLFSVLRPHALHDFDRKWQAANNRVRQCRRLRFVAAAIC